MERRENFSPVANTPAMNPYGKVLKCLSIVMALRVCISLSTVNLAKRTFTAKDLLAQNAVTRGSIDTHYHLNKL